MYGANFLNDAELFALTSPFLNDEFSKEEALTLASKACISMLIEPGDQMAGALERTLGLSRLIELLLGGLDVGHVVSSLRSNNSLDELREKFGNLERTIVESQQRWLPRLSKSRLERLFIQSSRLKLSLITHQNINWPKMANDLGDFAPSLFFVMGDPKVLGGLEDAVSIVGSRAASAYGCKVSQAIASRLARENRTTVSGGAVGIDAMVHQSCLELDSPTIAVMAGGLDRVYPKQNVNLFQKLQGKGCLLSELPPGLSPTRWRFLQRNRIIAALTPMTVVVEAGQRSGSIRTANDALELGRELYAVPGSIFSPSSKGVNELIVSGKAQALTDIDFFVSGHQKQAKIAEESVFAKRALDAFRELDFPSELEIARTAGLTQFELTLAINELRAKNYLVQKRDSAGKLHYALKHGR